VVRPYGEMGLVQIAANADEFISAIENALGDDATNDEWRQRVDKFLAQTSWDETWERMSAIIDQVLERKQITVPLLDGPTQQLGAATY